MNEADRLSTRLGLTVAALIGCLVLMMEMLAYAAISRQLDIRAEDALNEKFRQIEHSMSEGFWGRRHRPVPPHAA